MSMPQKVAGMATESSSTRLTGWSSPLALAMTATDPDDGDRDRRGADADLRGDSCATAIGRSGRIPVLMAMSDDREHGVYIMCPVPHYGQGPGGDRRQQVMCLGCLRRILAKRIITSGRLPSQHRRAAEHRHYGPDTSISLCVR